jgi:hypothetical protein
MNFYTEVIDAFNRNQVRLLVFNGFDVNFYGFNRYTADLDLWIDPSPSNLETLKQTMLQLGFEESDKLKDFLLQKMWKRLICYLKLPYPRPLPSALNKRYIRKVYLAKFILSILMI